MMEAQEKPTVRSSSRQRCRPVRFWDFEKPDYSSVEDISYNITLLSSRNNSILRVTRNRNSENVAANHYDTDKSKTDVHKLKPYKKILKRKGKENAVADTPATENVVSSTTDKENVLPASKNQLTKGKEKSKLQGEGGKIQKKETVKEPTRKRSRIAVESSSNDSGVTDMDDSYLKSMAGEVRTVETSAEISNIQESQMHSILKEQSKNTRLSSISYIANHKAPNFNNVLCSTAVSEDTIGQFNSPGNRVDTKRDFKVPLTAPKKLNKKSKGLEVVLDSIAEENESQNSGLQADVISEDVTPKKSNTLIKSRILNLTGDIEGGNRTMLKGKRKTANNSKIISRAEDTNSDITLSSQQMTLLNDSKMVRRSSRVRKKPLEYWNFEKAEVKTMDNGEVSVVYHKQIDPSETRKSSSTCDTVKVKRPPKHPALSEVDIKQIKAKRSLHSPVLNPPEGKKSSSKNNNLNSTADVPVLSPRKKRNDINRKSAETLASAVDVVNFDSLEFLPWETKDFTCYMARSYCNKGAVVYAGFLFIEKGQMIWTSTKWTNLCVISGDGILKILDSPGSGTLVHLEGKVKTVIPPGKKVSLEKQNADSTDLLKLFIVLQNRKP